VVASARPIPAVCRRGHRCPELSLHRRRRIHRLHGSQREPPPHLRRRYTASGTAFGPLLLAGMRIPVGGDV
jgi:hypothetical protein